MLNDSRASDNLFSMCKDRLSPYDVVVHFFHDGDGHINGARTDSAATTIGEIRASNVWPEYPADCRRKERAVVPNGDRLDVAVRAYDAALTRQHARTDRCAACYDQQRLQSIPPT